MSESSGGPLILHRLAPLFISYPIPTQEFSNASVSQQTLTNPQDCCRVDKSHRFASREPPIRYVEDPLHSFVQSFDRKKIRKQFQFVPSIDAAVAPPGGRHSRNTEMWCAFELTRSLFAFTFLIKSPHPGVLRQCIANVAAFPTKVCQFPGSMDLFARGRPQLKNLVRDERETKMEGTVLSFPLATEPEKTVFVRNLLKPIKAYTAQILLKVSHTKANPILSRCKRVCEPAESKWATSSIDARKPRGGHRCVAGLLGSNRIPARGGHRLKHQDVKLEPGCPASNNKKIKMHSRGEHETPLSLDVPLDFTSILRSFVAIIFPTSAEFGYAFRSQINFRLELEPS
ncbi:hypothetical protein EVAR_54967_1 [Eumeta japonica]|uniref:Uncharacterized protein n=1 Tax=Eumeta variegata TaxID=151549 RepID=A0A4C1YMF1_EUMVA|nr:hypothetical protein EVAR_54967_1 [Eumeta japonica]